jgi:hypothetical protein
MASSMRCSVDDAMLPIRPASLATATPEIISPPCVPGVSARYTIQSALSGRPILNTDGGMSARSVKEESRTKRGPRPSQRLTA